MKRISKRTSALLAIFMMLTLIYVLTPNAAQLSVEKLIPYDDNMNRTCVKPYAVNTLLSAVNSTQKGTSGSAVDLGFAAGQHLCFVSAANSDPTAALLKIYGSPDNSTYKVIATIDYVAATDTSHVKSITGSPTRYLKGQWTSATVALHDNTLFTIKCVSGGL